MKEYYCEVGYKNYHIDLKVVPEGTGVIRICGYCNRRIVTTYIYEEWSDQFKKKGNHHE